MLSVIVQGVLTSCPLSSFVILKYLNDVSSIVNNDESSIVASSLTSLVVPSSIVAVPKPAVLISSLILLNASTNADVSVASKKWSFLPFSLVEES